MNIVFNGIPETFESVSLAVLLHKKSLSEKKGIAVAINNMVIPRSQWSETLLNDGDSVLVITAAAGG